MTREHIGIMIKNSAAVSIVLIATTLLVTVAIGMDPLQAVTNVRYATTALAGAVMLGVATWLASEWVRYLRPGKEDPKARAEMVRAAKGLAIGAAIVASAAALSWMMETLLTE